MDIYPLPQLDDDPRFNAGLLFDVARLLRDRGDPMPHSGRDLIRLQTALFDFLYGGPEDDERDRAGQ